MAAKTMLTKIECGCRAYGGGGGGGGGGVGCFWKWMVSVYLDIHPCSCSIIYHITAGGWFEGFLGKTTADKLHE